MDISVTAALRYQFRVFAGSKPWLFFGLYQLSRDNKRLMVGADTELVIEGFPRSANTYAVVAFQVSQRRKVRIAHHLHAQAQVLRAIRLGVPTCVLIREPQDAIRSLLVRHRHITWNAALTHYLEFYGDLLDHRDNFVIASFQQVVSDFGTVVRSMNQRFGTQFLELVNTKETARRIAAEIDEINMRLEQGREDAVARPSLEREKLKRAVADPIGEREVRMLDRANQLFKRYTEAQ